MSEKGSIKKVTAQLRFRRNVDGLHNFRIFEFSSLRALLISKVHSVFLRFRCFFHPKKAHLDFLDIFKDCGT